MQTNQIDLEQLAPTAEYTIMSGNDIELEEEIREVISQAARAITSTMRMGKLVRVKKGKPCNWKSGTVREHLAHSLQHHIQALGGNDPMNVDEETSLPNLFHGITRDAFALVRHCLDEERLEARAGNISEANEE